MKRQTRTIGSILKIELGDQSHSYAMILDKASIAVFNIKTRDELSAEEILNTDTLFIVAVYKSSITSGRWPKIHKSVLPEKFKVLPPKFIQDPIQPWKFQLYEPNSGKMTDCSREDCLGLECAAVWEAPHVESRIVDHFNGVENKWVRLVSIK